MISNHSTIDNKINQIIPMYYRSPLPVRRMDIRNSSGYNEQSWTRQINKLLTGLQGDPTDLTSVFIDTFYDVGPSQFATMKFQENTARLLQHGLENNREPFQCKDIEIARSEILEQQKRLTEMTAMVTQMEQEKQNLMMALEMMKHKNFLLEKSNEDLMTMSTMSPLQGQQPASRLSHSTTSLVIVCLIILVLGLVTGVGLTTWYNHACSEVNIYHITLLSFYMILLVIFSSSDFYFKLRRNQLKCRLIRVTTWSATEKRKTDSQVGIFYFHDLN